MIAAILCVAAVMAAASGFSTHRSSDKAGSEIMARRQMTNATIAAGNMGYQTYIGDWTDIVKVAACSDNTAGHRSDGTVAATGENDEGECDVSDRTGIELPESDPALSERTVVDVSTLPDSLNAFLRQFHGGYWDAAGSWQDPPDDKIFDYEHAADGSSNIMAGILGPEASCVDYTLYPGAWTDEVWGTADPRGWQSSYQACGGPAIDWIAKNIFNISDEDILTLVQQADDLHVFYADSMDNGELAYFVPLVGGVGGFFNEARLISAETDGVLYYVTYEVYEAGPDGQPDGFYQKTYQAEVELKNIDGEDYWSMYRNAPVAQAEGENGTPLDEWLGVWYADTGEYLDIRAVSDTGLSLVYHDIIETGSVDTDYEMEFDDADKTIASEIGDMAAIGGWEYTLVLGDGCITVQSRYPDQTYIKSEGADPAATATLTVTGDQVNIRTGPGTDYEAIGMVSSANHQTS